MLLHRIRVQTSALMPGNSKSHGTPVPGDTMASSGLHQHLSSHVHSDIQETTYIFKMIINIFKDTSKKRFNWIHIDL